MRKQAHARRTTYLSHLMNVYPVVQAPHCLEVVLHALLQFLRDLVQREEVFEVSPLGLEQRAARVHALDNGCYVAEHHSVHQS